MGNAEQGKIKARNGVVDLLKFIFALMIVFYHTKGFANGKFLITGGYIAVDFFFIVSGYYLAVSAAKQRNRLDGSVARDSIRYILKRLARIYPYMFTATILSLCVRAAVYHLSFGEAIKLFFEAFGEWSLLQQAGVETKILIGATWYISAMVIASCVLYPFSRALGRKFDLYGALIFFAAFFALTISQLSNIQVPNEKLFGVVYIGLLRGFMDMSLGCVVYAIKDGLKGAAPSRGMRMFLTAAEVLLYSAVIIYYSFGKHYNRLDWFTIIILGIAVLITQTGLTYTGEVIHGRVYGFLGEFSFALYLGHRV